MESSLGATHLFTVHKNAVDAVYLCSYVHQEQVFSLCPVEWFMVHGIRCINKMNFLLDLHGKRFF